VNSAYQSNGD